MGGEKAVAGGFGVSPSFNQPRAHRRTTEGEVRPSAVQPTAHLSHDSPRRRLARAVTITARAYRHRGTTAGGSSDLVAPHLLQACRTTSRLRTPSNSRRRRRRLPHPTQRRPPQRPHGFSPVVGAGTLVPVPTSLQTAAAKQGLGAFSCVGALYAGFTTEEERYRPTGGW
jgi:hypothetical protein